MTLSESDIDHVVKLAHLEIDEGEKKTYITQLSRVLADMDCLNKLDLSTDRLEAYEPTPQREDSVAAHDKSSFFALMESNAPDWEEPCFVVPKIVT